jgi:hypothetical protein
MSVLDTLAHQILILYDVQQRPSKIYIGTVRDKLAKSHSKSALAILLAGKTGQLWFNHFQRFRNCTTHESLIGYDNVDVSYDPITGEIAGARIILPDDPKARPFSYAKKREAKRYCRYILGNINSLISNSYRSILVDIRKANNVLPIP